MAETACLLNMCTGDRTGGSNPPLSATSKNGMVSQVQLQVLNTKFRGVA